MPKIIRDVEEIILEEAKKELLENGYRDLTIRSLAKRSGIAVGTIYNHFESKNVIVARAIFIDWAKTLEKMSAHAKGSDDIIDVCRDIYDEMEEFIKLYIKVFDEYDDGLSDYNKNYAIQHGTFITQIAKVINDTLESLGYNETEFMGVFIAESINNVASNPNYSYDDLELILKKIFK